MIRYITILCCMNGKMNKLLKECDYHKNGDLKPENFKVVSHEKVNWVCI
ncbi:zinc-ribbon domain-containing protein [Peribacillus simplex]